MGKVDYKLISVLNADILSHQVLNNNEIFIFTPSGLFVGYLYQVDPEKEKKEDGRDDEQSINIAETFTESIKLVQEKFAEKDEFIETSGFIILENVKYYPQGSGNGNISMPFVQIFSDQIVGITIGTTSTLK